MKKIRIAKRKGDIVRMFVEKGKRFYPFPMLVTASDKNDNAYWCVPLSYEAAQEADTYNNYTKYDRDSVDMATKLSNREANILIEALVGLEEMPE